MITFPIEIEIERGGSPDLFFDALVLSRRGEWIKWSGESLNHLVVSERQSPELLGYKAKFMSLNLNNQELSAREIATDISRPRTNSTLTEALAFFNHCFRMGNEVDDLVNYLHLHKKGIICPGSQLSDGGIPSIHFRGKKFVIQWCQPELTVGLQYFEVIIKK